MQHGGRHEAAESRAMGFHSTQGSSVMALLQGISDSAVKTTSKRDRRAELHAAKLERAQQRREDRRKVQERRELIDELVGMIRDDATLAGVMWVLVLKTARYSRIPLSMIYKYCAPELSKLCNVLPRNLSLERLDISRNNLVGADIPRCQRSNCGAQ